MLCECVCELAIDIFVHAQAYAAVSGPLLLSNWQLLRGQGVIYTTATTGLPSRNSYKESEASDGALCIRCRGLIGIGCERGDARSNEG